LELGGKSPNIVFADTEDLAKAAQVSAMGIFRNSGQVCIAGSKILVERSIHREFVEQLVAIAEGLKIGDPLDLEQQIGCVANAAQLERNLAFVARAKEQGAVLLTGGEALHQVSGGCYMQPTIFDEVDPEMDIANCEAFGPILAVIPFDTEEQAIAIANSTEFGLAAALWTANLSRAHRLVKAVKAGVVHVNTYGGADITVPLGGHKQSGNGVDKSLHAIDKYTELKTAWIQL
ncbi:MAG: aldehyde dehydrogenase family protein, partial [Pseudomonadales bacterium]